MKLFIICSILVTVLANDEEQKYGGMPGMFWPPYQSHLLQSTKAQSMLNSHQF